MKMKPNGYLFCVQWYTCKGFNPPLKGNIIKPQIVKKSNVYLLSAIKDYITTDETFTGL